MQHPLARYSVKDFDNFDCLKLSWFYYAILLYLIKGYAVALLSFSNMRDKLALIKYVYPDPQALYMALVTGIPGLILFILLMARRPSAGEWLKKLWPRYYGVLVVAVCGDFFVQAALCFWWQMITLNVLVAQFIVASILLVACRFDHRARYNLTEFPVAIDTEKSSVKRAKAE
ncbi:DUF2919 family protein [Thalassotalea maritima]|uniref:DUF2919 family protein n=1 Tax=Thalassotalea maritima TaxID=3242416 RepID=UPI003528F2F3